MINISLNLHFKIVFICLYTDLQTVELNHSMICVIKALSHWSLPPYTYSSMWPEIEKILEIPNSEVKFLQNIWGSVIFTKSYVNFHSSLVLTGFVFMLCHQSGIYITAFCYALQIEFRQGNYEALVNKSCKVWGTSGMLCRFFKVFIEQPHTCRNGCPVNNSVPKRYRSLKIYKHGGCIPKSCLFWRQFELKIGKLSLSLAILLGLWWSTSVKKNNDWKKNKNYPDICQNREKMQLSGF